LEDFKRPNKHAGERVKQLVLGNALAFASEEQFNDHPMKTQEQLDRNHIVLEQIRDQEWEMTVRVKPVRVCCVSSPSDYCRLLTMSDSVKRIGLRYDCEWHELVMLHWDTGREQCRIRLWCIAVSAFVVLRRAVFIGT
jgi:hypothetical protein